MKIIELLTIETIILPIKGNTKTAVIEELIDVLERTGRISNYEHFKYAVMERESQSTTGIGDGVAIPHAKHSTVIQPSIVFGRSDEGIDFESLDGAPSHLFFMIAVPEDANHVYLNALSRLATILLNEDARNQLMDAPSPLEILDIINKYDQKEEEEEEENTTEIKSDFLVAVTACPAGIAHTYLAANSLKETADRMGVSIKIETNGLSGAKNILTQEEIANATGVIVAADLKVNMERFKGKPVLVTSVADGIHKPEELIRKALQKKLPICSGEDSNTETNPIKNQINQQRGILRSLYKHIMNGVSNMLPLMVSGGILIAISHSIGFDNADHPNSMIAKIATLLNQIGLLNAFALILPIFSGFIASSISDRPGFATGAVAGLMAANGGGGFLGSLLAGIIAGYVVLGLKRLFSPLPLSLAGFRSIILYPLFGMVVTGIIMNTLISPLSVVHNLTIGWISNIGFVLALLFAAIVGIMMAYDLGGPINKLAYLLGLGLLFSGVYEPMASIMAAGMVPPLATALATTLFSNQFTEQERSIGKTNYILGLTFVTEGALPFVKTDRHIVIPSFVIGSTIASIVSMTTHSKLIAPHGGVFVIPLIEGNSIIYFLGILTGALISAILIGLQKKSQNMVDGKLN